MPNEEDIRAALRARAGQAHDAQDVLTAITERRALQPSAASGGRRPALRNSRRWPVPGRRRARVLLAPAAATAAVVAVILVSVVVWGRPSGQGPTAGSHVSLRSAPRYYVALLPAGPLHRIGRTRVQFDDAVVRDTLTGSTLATIHVPKPFDIFDSVTGAGDDRTFVLAASVETFNPAPVKFFLARFDPTTDAVTLTAPHVPELAPRESLMGMALSPAGTELAVAVLPDRYVRRSVGRVSVYSLTNGAVRSWQSYGEIGMDPSGSWSRRGTLAFNWDSGGYVVRGQVQNSPADGVYLLNVASAGGSLLAHSRQVVRAPRTISPLNGFDYTSAVLIPDGNKVIVPVGRFLDIGSGASQKAEYAFEEFSIPRGRLIRTLDRTHSAALGGNSVEWTSPAGGVLVVEAPEKPGGKIVLGVLSGRRFVPIPGAPPEAIVNEGSNIAF